MTQVMAVETITLVGGWAEANKFAFRSPTNMAIIQARGNNDLQVSKGRNTEDYFTIKAGTYLPVSTFNANDVLYFRGTTGDVVEIWIHENMA